jgi:hypothetical protein
VAKAAARFSTKARNSGLGQIFDEIRSTSKKNDSPSIGYETDFISSANGLGINLFPSQEVIAKMTFGVPLDYKDREVLVYDKIKTKLLYKLSGPDFVKYLHSEGRCNINDWRDVPRHGFKTTVIVAGRRGGKSEVVGAIAGTMLRKLLSIYSPQEYYGLIDGSPVDFTFLGTDEKSSTRLYNKLKSQINRSSFFTPYLRGEPGTRGMKFVAEADRDKRDIDPSITVASYVCTTQAVRGPSSYFLGLDEFAHFRSSDDANSDEIYESATPSSSMFPSKEDPERADSKILVISSPVSKIGKFYELHKQALDEGKDSKILTFRLSTVEMNPRIPAEELRAPYKRDPVKFEMEYAACFSDGAGSYVPPEKFNVLINKERENVTRFEIKAVGRKFFWGFDSAMKKDASALAIGHLELIEGSGIHLVYDYIDRMMCGEAFTGPGVLNGGRVALLTELDLRDVVSWLVYMHNYLPCFKGCTDQHGGVTLKQLLQLNGITTMELVHLTDQINSKMYNALQGYIFNGAASFPNVPKFATEFNALVAEYKSKYVLRVEAPKEKGAHDDMADAVALVAWQAQTWLDEEGKLDLDPTAQILQVDPRVANPVCIVDPNSVSMADLRIMARQYLVGDGLNLPPSIPIQPSQRKWSMRGRR